MTDDRPAPRFDTPAFGVPLAVAELKAERDELRTKLLRAQVEVNMLRERIAYLEAERR